MRRTSKIMAGVAVATASLVAVPAVAQAEPDNLIELSQDGDLLPICINEVKITLFGVTLIDLPVICIG